MISGINPKGQADLFQVIDAHDGLCSCLRLGQGGKGQPRKNRDQSDGRQDAQVAHDQSGHGQTVASVFLGLHSDPPPRFMAKNDGRHSRQQSQAHDRENTEYQAACGHPLSF